LRARIKVAGAVAEAVLVPGRNVLRVDVPRPAPWWPNGEGEPVLHDLRIEVRQPPAGRTWTFERRVGFKHIEWRANPGAPADALPWLCVVNGRPVFLQGVNWTPVRLGYQDTTGAEYARLVGLYRAMGCNTLRVWGGAFLESGLFHDLCDRHGLLVWAEFPLSSSGLDNEPPHAPATIEALCGAARHFVRSRRHHASLLLWCGGNELQVGRGGDHLAGRPCTLDDPCLAALAAVVAGEDPGRRFVPTSPSGPKFYAREEDFGKGLHHHVHGPWGFGDFPAYADWLRYWERDDSTFRSEVGVPSMNTPELLRRHADGEPAGPTATPLWRHSAGWWTQAERLLPRFAHLGAGAALEACAAFTRQEQADALAHAARCSKERFPACGGFLVWMGHDCFPCPANTSVIDFDHQPKPAWHALRAVFLAKTAVQA
jgi:beta-mannosidase